MSIFRSSFTPEVQNQLKTRQDALINRTPASIQYINSRNAWIRMTSAVDVNDDKGALAKNYVLLGGTLLNNNILRTGVGNSTQAYSTQSPGGKPHLRGIRPMPGITNIEVKSKAAYGSLREVIVNFNCWDITQLEDLEVLYMRPGYTVLIEWGWLPYLDNKNNLINTPPQFYDILNKGETERTLIFKELFAKSKTLGGNYDAMYGYVKNYSWSARPDGGYDCQTTIISTGEIIESLKINYIKPSNTTSNKALLNGEIASGVNFHVDSNNGFEKNYAKNILAGLWYETYHLLKNPQLTYNNNIFTSKNFTSLNIPLTSTPNSNGSSNLSGDGSQVYITLEVVINLLNKYVIPKELLTLSLNKNTYDDNGDDLLCIAHPLQVSVDPTVCLINSPLWSGDEFTTTVEKAANLALNDITKTTAEASFKLIYNAYSGPGTNEDFLIKGIQKITDTAVYDQVNELIKNKGDYNNLQDVLQGELESGNLSTFKIIQSHLVSKGIKATYTPTYQKNTNTEFLDPSSIELLTPDFSRLSSANKIIQRSKQSIANLKNINKNLNSYYFYNNDPYIEIGTIKNIYVNVDYLYKLSLDLNLESQDKKEKNEINIYNYLKSLISRIQTSIGNINTFEIHIDPIDNKARIIDINYTEPKKSKYDSLFELQVHNLKSIVRSYTLQSQIFPEQSSIIAIGAQAKGGQLGMQNNTMIDFNRSLIDRITPTRGDNSFHNGEQGIEQLTTVLAVVIQLLSNLGNKPPEDPSKQNDTSVSFDEAKNALRDLIVYFQSITSSPGKNRNLIPIKFSFEMDGIGGLVIGHMFKLPSFILPRGYRGNKIGAQLAQTVTSISHTINNNDWVTKIDALNIVLNDNTSLVSFADIDLTKILVNSFNPSSNKAIPGSLSSVNADSLKEYLLTNKIANIKNNELNDGGDIELGISSATKALLSLIKYTYPDISLTVTSGNDSYHQNLVTKSNHTYGKAVDFTVFPATPDNINKVDALIKQYQATQGKDMSGGFLFRYLNEYTTRSVNATDGHFHISYNVFTKGA